MVMDHTTIGVLQCHKNKRSLTDSCELILPETPTLPCNFTYFLVVDIHKIRTFPINSEYVIPLKNIFILIIFKNFDEGNQEG